MFFLNFYSLASIIAFLFMGIIAIFLVSVKNKSLSTLHLMIAYMCMTVFQAAYLFTAIYYDSFAAFHRWVTVLIVFLALLHMTQFFLRYPANFNKKLANIYLMVQYGLAFVLTIIFIVHTYTAQRVYHFDGHYWDFDAEAVSRLIAVFIVLYYVIFVSTSLVRFFYMKGKERKALLYTTLVLALTIIVPVVANVLSRDGRLDRGTYQTMFVLLSVLGFFGALIIYINNTKERTTFMVKIIGITLVTFLVLFQWLTYLFLGEKNISYDRIHHEIAWDGVAGKWHPDMLYFASINMPISTATSADQSTSVSKPISIEIKSKNAIEKNKHDHVNLKRYLPEIQNSYMVQALEKIPNELSAAFFQKRAIALVKNSPESFAGFRNVLLKKMSEHKDIAQQIPMNQKKYYRQIINEINNELFVHFNKIKNFPVENFKPRLRKYLAKMKTPLLRDFQTLLMAKLQDPAYKQNQKLLRQQVLSLVTPAWNPESRRYRTYKKNGKELHYISFLRFNIEKQYAYEAGFSYLKYRQEIHLYTLPLFYILLGILAIILFLFPLFFRGSLLSPLSRLLQGVNHINEGHLKVYVKPHVQDEIGYLSNTFNIMARTIRETSRKLRDYAQNLEDKVERRTNELQKSLAEVNALKMQQDGDYFLTSLLIKPLGTNEAQSALVNIDFYVRQKKEFHFRQWNTEIGGDICIANKIQLRGKEFVVFLNGDAMGKSIQGAGGALVLGVVFRAQISRTQIVRQEQNRYPEQWLKDAFVELQKVFESFDGSMLISVAMGLIDEKTGLMYYMNAEHPWTVLYRQGRATFIEDELMLHKIGTTGLGGNLTIRTFQLQPGDVIIAGSDGRDDFVLYEDNKGKRVINEDETLFLDRVKEGGGDLSRIVQSIEKQGSLTDDLSLLRLGYLESNQGTDHPGQMGSQDQMDDTFMGHFERGHRLLEEEGQLENALTELREAYAIFGAYPELLRDLSRAYLKKKDYRNAASFCDAYIVLRPDDVRFIYYASISFKKIRQLERAVDLGERVRLRHPNLVHNLLNLGDCYRLLGNKDRAQMMLELALEQNPSEPSALELQNALRMSSNND